MKEKINHPTHRRRLARTTAIFRTFIKDESIGGKLILIAALLSLFIVNSSLGDVFNRFWQTQLSLGIGSWSLSLDLRHWVNEALMALFFLVVGLEIKREFVKGELKNRQTAALPVGAAVGGMIIPALLYLLLNPTAATIQGWGIPIATDIAFALAILSLLGNRVPVALKIFLLTLAITDDIGAIFVIALFCAEIINYWYLAASFLLALVIFLVRKQLTGRLLLMSLLGIVLWVTTHRSGIHASIVGAVLGFIAPISHTNKEGIAEKAERSLLPVTTFFVLPLFALTNAGFVVNASALTTNQSVLWGVLIGLVFGKVIGVSLASWLLVKAKLAALPRGVTWRHIHGVGFIAGIGFTVSIFITELAFSGHDSPLTTAKMAIFIASAISALCGYLLLRTAKPVAR